MADGNFQLFGAMMRGSGQYDPHIRHAIFRLRGMAINR